MPDRPQLPLIARTIRRLSVLIVLGWAAFTLLFNVAVPQLERVGREHSVPLSPQDAPAVAAMTRIGKVFQESDSDSFAMIVLESQQQLGEDAHAYYDRLVRELRTDPQHIENVQDLWSNRVTAAGAESADGRAVYVQLNLAGNQGTTLGQESVAAVRDIVGRTPPPAGLDVYVTGPAALYTDLQRAGDSSILKISGVGALIIFIVLFVVYRSIMTVILLLCTVGVEIFAARGIVAFLGNSSLIVLSTFAVNLLVALAMAAGTDYGIFFFSRYQEARQSGEDRETAYYTTYRSVAPVVLGSGLTIAGAMLCLGFTRMPIFQTVGVPCAVGLLLAVAIALTLVPATLTIGSRFGLFDPVRRIKVRRWRRIGTAIVRWPVPILTASVAVALIGLLALPGYQTSYDDRAYAPKNIPANAGYRVADSHFSQSRMQPDILMIEARHDMRNPADFIVLHKLAKAIFRVPGVSRVQGITRPEGTPIEHTSIPFVISMQNAAQTSTLKFVQKRTDELLVQADLLSQNLVIMKRLYELQAQLTDNTLHSIGISKELQVVVDGLRDHFADLQDFLRPIQNIFFWEPHCYTIPICWMLHEIFVVMDTIDPLSELLGVMVTKLDKMGVLLPELLEQMPPLITMVTNARTMILKMHSTMSGIFDQIETAGQNAMAMGQAFDAARNDDSFYLPQDVFDNPDFQQAMKSFISPDGKAARFIISHRGDPATAEGIARIDQIRSAAEEALKTTPLEDAKIYMAGTASTFKDFHDGSDYDLLIAGVGALCLIFIIMLAITRSFIAATVIVGTVALSLGASFGLSVIAWQYIFGMKLHWMVLPMTVIVLLAVGSDYNLLLVSRIKEEISAGLNTGIIRAMGGTGKVVTNAGLVFAFTMTAMVVSELRIIGQVGTTIALGLLFDTLVVRSFMTPSIAALLGRWFWWPQVVRQRPPREPFRVVAPAGRPSPSVPGDHGDDPITSELPRPLV